MYNKKIVKIILSFLFLFLFFINKYKVKDYEEIKNNISKIDIIYRDNSGIGDDRLYIYKFSLKDDEFLNEYKKYFKNVEELNYVFESTKNIILSLEEENCNNCYKVINELYKIKDEKYVKSFYIYNGRGTSKLYIYSERLNIGYLIYIQI